MKKAYKNIDNPEGFRRWCDGLTSRKSPVLHLSLDERANFPDFVKTYGREQLIRVFSPKSLSSFLSP